MRIAASAACLMLASCVTTDDAIAPGAQYVAMGSSYAAGAGLPPVKAGAPERCGRSEVSYPSLLAKSMQLDLRDASCGGARTPHLLGAWDELPPQVDAVGPDTRLVTITIGGNDLDYVRNMYVASCRAGVPMEAMRREAGGECHALTIQDQADYLAVQQRLEEAVAEIRRRAPNAQILLVQYPWIIPDEDCAAAPLLAEDRTALAEIGEGLAEATRRAGANSSARVIAVEAMSRDHTACDAEPWSVAFSAQYRPEQGSPWHPDAAGHAAVARIIERELRQ